MTRSICQISVFLVALIDLVSGNITPAVPGSTVTLHCQKAPSTNLLWEHSDAKRVIARSGVLTDVDTSSKYEVTQRQDSESLTVRSLTLSDDGEYRCYYSNSVFEAQVMAINVLVRPRTMYATGPVHPVSESTNQMLNCEVNGVKPLPQIKWIRKDYSGNFTEFLGSNEDSYFPNKTGNRRNTLVFKITRKDYRAVFICQASIVIFYSMQHNITLDVLLLPQSPVITGLSGSYDPGTSSSLQCVVRGARPPAVISWYLGGHQMESINSLPEVSPDGTFVSTSRLLMAASFREEDTRVSCRATNQAVRESGVTPPATNTMLRMNYAPTVKLNLTRDVVNEGEDAVLYCIVSSRPLPDASEVKWLKSGVVTSGGRFKLGNTSNPYLVIRDVTRHDAGIYRCHVSNHLGFAESESITLVVHYKPYCVENQRTKYAIATGSSAKIKCEVGAFPNDVTFKWIHPNTNGRMSVTVMRGLTDSSDPYHAVSYQNVTVRYGEDYRSVACNASNSVGTMVQSCYIHIVPPGPPEAPVNCSVEHVTNSSLVLSCLPGFDGGHHQTFSLFLSKHGRRLKLAQIWDTPQFLVTGLDPNTSYSLRVCARNSQFPETPNCSGFLIVLTLKGPPALPHDDVSSAEIGAYVAIAICLLVVVVVIAVCLVYWRVYRTKRDDKPSRGRVVVARSTGSLVFDTSDHRAKKYSAQGELKTTLNDSNPDVYISSREKQLKAIVDRIDWREGLRDVDYTNRGAELDTPASSNLELSNSRTSAEGRTRPDGNTMTYHPHGTPHVPGAQPETALNNNGVLNCGFEDSGAIGAARYRVDNSYRLRRPVTDSETDCEGSSETTMAGMDRMGASGSESGWGSPRKPYSDSDRKSNCSNLRNQFPGDSLMRSGSYNLAISGNVECSPKSSSTTTSGGQSTFCHLQDARYHGIKPAYF